jgi:hypothetical protein
MPAIRQSFLHHFFSYQWTSYRWTWVCFVETVFFKLAIRFDFRTSTQHDVSGALDSLRGLVESPQRSLYTRDGLAVLALHPNVDFGDQTRTGILLVKPNLPGILSVQREHRGGSVATGLAEQLGLDHVSLRLDRLAMSQYGSDIRGS